MMAEVKVLYIRNVILSSTEARIEEAFSKFAPVERVDCFQDELVPVFERFGRIYEMRLMMDYTGMALEYQALGYVHLTLHRLNYAITYTCIYMEQNTVPAWYTHKKESYTSLPQY